MRRWILILLLLAIWPVTLAAEERIILDAGHGGEDGGTSAADGTQESDLNWQITQRLDLLLTFLGERTVLTRTGEGSVASPKAVTLREKKRSDLRNRVAQINAIPEGKLVSIHQNSLPQHPEVHGAQVFYNRVTGAEDMARAVQDALNHTVNGQNEKHCKPIAPDIFLMKKARCPAILVECGFLSHGQEALQLQDKAYQKKLAAAIAAGCLSYQKAREKNENENDLLLHRVRK